MKKYHLTEAKDVKLYIAIICTMFATFDLKSTEYAVYGQLTYVTYYSTGAEFARVDQDFAIEVKDCNWHIKTISKRNIVMGKEQDLEDYTIASSDSTYFYHLISLETVASKRNAKASSTGAIGPGGIPFGISDPILYFVWYSFCSPCYLQNLGNSKAFPPMRILKTSHYASDFKVPLLREMLQKPPFFPKALSFTSSSTWLHDPDNNPKTGNQFTNFIFQLVNTTNLNGYEFPFSGFFKCFDRHPKKTNEIFLANELTFTITNVGLQCSIIDFKPEISNGAALTDLRPISSGTPIAIGTGVIKDWPDESSSKWIAIKKIGLRQKHLVKKSKEQFAIQCAIVLILISPGIMYVWKLAKKKP